MSSLSREAPRRIRLLGGEVDLVSPAAVLEAVSRAVRARSRLLVVNHNLNSLRLIRKWPAMAALYRRADLIEIDSTPLALWGKLLGLGSSRAHRSTWLDWRETFWSLAHAGRWRVFHLGCRPGVGDQAAHRIRARWSGVNLEVLHGHFDIEGPENAQVLRRIRDFAPDVLLVGMGMPRQEIWIETHFERLPDCAILPVGAAFDYEAGVAPTPPRWSGRLGLEWAARLAAEPRRLYARYLIEPWALAPAALADLRRALFRAPANASR